ncbi:MAG: FMN-binding protein [Rikenellaceae bacterium]
MKNIVKITSLLLIFSSAILFAQSKKDAVREVLEDGTVVISSKTLAKDIFGYASTTPIKLHIKNGVISNIEYELNNETPDYFDELLINDTLAKKWIGKGLKDAATAQVDAISGSTFSSEAVNENIRRAAKYELGFSK